MSELNAELPLGFWVHVNETSLNGGANFTTLMKHLVSSGLCPTFTELKTVTSGTHELFLPDSGAVQSTRGTLMKCMA